MSSKRRFLNLILIMISDIILNKFLTKNVKG